jgi:ATP-binding cassette subfamily B protein
MKSKTKLSSLFSVVIRSLQSAWKFDKKAMSVLTILRIITTLSGYAQIALMGFIIDELITVIQTSASPETLYGYIMMYTAVLVVPSMLAKWYTFVDTHFFRIFVDYLDMEFTRSVATRDIQTIENSEYQNSRSKAREQGSWNVYGVVDSAIRLLTRFISIVVALGYLGSLNWRFAVLGAIAALPSLLVEYIHGKRVYGAWDEDTVERRIWEYQKDQIHTKSDLIEIKLFRNVKWFMDVIWKFTASFQQKLLAKDKQRVGDEVIGVIVNGAAFAGALYLITIDALVGAITVGGITVALGAYSKLEGDLSELFSAFGRISKNVRYAKDYFVVIDTPAVMIHSGEPQTVSVGAVDIEFRDVCFHYPGSDTWIFQGLNLRLKAGERVALVGHNGAGKTTLVHLLLRIYDVSSGQILVNGVDIREVDIDQYYANTAALMQEFATFKFPVRQAIALGDTSVPYDESRMLAAARASHAYSFIERWENAYDSMIGREFDGKELSGGERQRMAIARVFYRDTGLVILDEPTSAVDAIAEQEIFESIYNSQTQKTILTISHRFSTVKKSDVIIVLEHGKVVEQGSHTELIEHGGLYYDLYSAQASAYTD